MTADETRDTIHVGNVVASSGIAIGAGAVANVVNVHFGGLLPTLDLHALRRRLAALGAPSEALNAVDAALAGLPAAESAYRDALRRAYGPWRDVFVALDLHADEARRQRQRRTAPWMRPEFCAVEHLGPGQVQRVALGSLAEALARYPAIALLGEPGAGKTTAMEHLAGELAQDGEDRLPLVVDLARYRHDAVLPFIAEAWPATLADRLDDDLTAARMVTDPLLAHLEGYLRAGRLVVLFDALNEMPHLPSHSQRREQLRAFVDRWQKTGNRFAVSCRVLDYTGGELAGLQQVEVERLPVERVGQALAGYLPDKGPGLWAQLQRPEHALLLDLLRTPYFLYMLVEVYARPDAPATLPAGRAELLERFADTLFKREEYKGYPDWIEPDAQREALGALAYRMQREGQGGASGTAVPLAQARTYLPPRVTVRGRRWDVSPDVLLRLAAAASLLRIGLDERGRWRDARFWHQLLQEYFAAGELERRFADGEDLAGLWRWPYWLEGDMPRWEQPPDKWEPMPAPPGSGWEETTVLMAGLSSDPSRLVEAVVEANPVLAGRCLAESGAAVDEAVRGRVQRALLATMRDPQVALRVRIAAGNVLGAVGDPRFSGPYLLPELVAIPAGPFTMGGREEENEQPIHEVVLGEYAIARYPVTNAQYGCFVAAGGYREERYWPPGEARAWLRGEAVESGAVKERMDVWRAVRADPATTLDQLRQWGRSPQEIALWAQLSQMEEEQAREFFSEAYADRPRDRPAYWDNAGYNNPAQPVVGVSWYEARAYCAWLTERWQMADGKLQVWRGGERLAVRPSEVKGFRVRLPGEAEWEKAARGGIPPAGGGDRGGAGNRYPWGDGWDAARANTVEGGVYRPTPVGIYPGGATPQGVHDLSGNVWEWTGSLYRPYPYRPDDGREELAAEGYRVVRGGSWYFNRWSARCAYRYWFIPVIFDNLVGFRLVVSLAL